MTEQHENREIDQLFKDAFDGLPETPANNGWDQPSDKVWENVGKSIKPRSGISLAQGAGIGALLVVSALVLYTVFTPQAESPASQPETPTAPVEQQEVAVEKETPAQNLTIETQDDVVSGPAIVSSTKENKPTPAEAAQDRPRVNNDENAPRAINDGRTAEPLPGTDPSQSVNNYEKLRKEVWKRPLSPLPKKNMDINPENR